VAKLKSLEQRCEVCLQGKQAALPFSGTRTRASRPLELVHSDVLGPVTPMSHDGKRFAIVFVDDFTHLVFFYDFL